MRAIACLWYRHALSSRLSSRRSRSSRSLSPRHVRRAEWVLERRRRTIRCPLSAMIQLIDVHKAFGSKKVLQGFTLDVVEGETMVIIGYSGTGKSVAIKHIVGLLEPDAGQVIVDGLDVPNLS